MKSILTHIRNGLLTVPSWLASAKLAAILLIHLVAFTLVAALSPSRTLEGYSKSTVEFLKIEQAKAAPVLDFQDRFESATFVLLLISLSISLAFSLYFRLKTERKRVRLNTTNEDVASSEPLHTSIQHELRRCGYRTVIIPNGHSTLVRGTKGASGTWGSIFFHASILVLLAAIVLSKYASFEGVVALTEGQAFDERTDQYLHAEVGRFYKPPQQPLSFRLLKVEPLYVVKRATTVASVVEAADKDGQHAVHLNNGLSRAGRTVHQGVKIGYSPYVIVAREDGLILLDGFLRLASLKHVGKVVHRDFLEFPSEELRLEVEFLPDAAFKNGAFQNQSDELKHPVMRIVLLKKGVLLLDEFVPLGSGARAGTYVISTAGLRRWSQFDVSDDPGLPLLVFGSLMGVVGLAMRLLSVRKHVAVFVQSLKEKIVIDLHGSTEKFQQTFNEELAALQAELKAVVVSYETRTSRNHEKSGDGEHDIQGDVVKSFDDGAQPADKLLHLLQEVE